jgi:hypothetical protein
LAVSVNLAKYIKRLFKHALSIVTPAGTGKVTILSESETPITKDTYQAELQDRGVTVNIDSPTSVTYNLRGSAESVPVSGSSVSVSVSGASVSVPVSGSAASVSVSGGTVSVPVSGSAVNVSVSGSAVSVTPVGASETVYTGTLDTLYTGVTSQTLYTPNGAVGIGGYVGAGTYYSLYSTYENRIKLTGTRIGYTNYTTGVGYANITSGAGYSGSGTTSTGVLSPTAVTRYQADSAVTLYNAPTTKTYYNAPTNTTYYNAPTTKTYYNAPTNKTYYNDGGTLTLKQADRVGADPATVQYLKTGSTPTASSVTDTITEEI